MELKAVLVVLLGLLGSSSAQSASCQYIDSSAGYTCYLSMVNPLGAEFDSIEGEHLEGFTNDDVAMVYSWDGSSANVPEVICRQFPNLVDLDLAFFGITTVTDQSFSGCANVNFLRLWWNQITEIPLNTFANNPLLSYLDLDGNNLTTLPENVFQNLANLEVLEIRNNPFENIPVGIFNGLSALVTLYMSNVRITQVNPQWFAPTTSLQTLLLYNNQIVSFNENSFSTLTSLLQLDIGINPLSAPIPANTFAPLTNLNYIYLDNLRLTEINPSWFSGLNNLMVLTLYQNQIASVAENTFEGLSSLWVLDLDYNRQISDFPEGTFNGLTSLNSLYLAGLNLWLVRPGWFATTPNLQFLMLNFNSIEDLLPGTFVNLNNLQYLGLWANNIKTLERGYFGNLNRLYYLDLDENTVNGLDQRVFNDAINLSIFYFWNNVCGSGSFFDFYNNRAQNFQRLNRCFRNFEFAVETVTEGDMNYRFYRFPAPGIMARIDTNSEIHISLNPVNFEAVPRIEIHIGVEGNTRSRIIRNGNEVVVDIPTPDIVRPIGWTGFRVIYSNFVVMVLREGEQWPFMGFQMVDFVHFNFYGIRTPNYVSVWSILPLEADGT